MGERCKREMRTACIAGVLEASVLAQIGYVDDLAGVELARSRSEGQWIAVGADA